MKVKGLCPEKSMIALPSFILDTPDGSQLSGHDMQEMNIYQCQSLSCHCRILMLLQSIIYKVPKHKAYSNTALSALTNINDFLETKPSSRHFNSDKYVNDIAHTQPLIFSAFFGCCVLIRDLSILFIVYCMYNSDTVTDIKTYNLLLNCLSIRCIKEDLTINFLPAAIAASIKFLVLWFMLC